MGRPELDIRVIGPGETVVARQNGQEFLLVGVPEVIEPTEQERLDQQRGQLTAEFTGFITDNEEDLVRVARGGKDEAHFFMRHNKGNFDGFIDRLGEVGYANSEPLLRQYRGQFKDDAPEVKHRAHTFGGIVSHMIETRIAERDAQEAQGNW